MVEMNLTKYAKNIVLLGDSAVGKTSLIRRYVLDCYDDKYITTIGKKVTKKEVVLETEDGKAQVNLMIWDIIGQKGYRQMQSTSFNHANGAILVSDLTRKETLESLLGYWIPLLLQSTGPIPMTIIGNKNDLADQIQISMAELQDMAEKCQGFGVKNECFVTSAKSGNNVDTVFLHLADKVIKAPNPIKLNISTELLDKDEISTFQDVVDHIIADFAEQFGGIDNATPFIRQQLERSGLNLAKPSEQAVIQFIVNLAYIEGTYKTPEEVEANRIARINLFGYKVK